MQNTTKWLLSILHLAFISLELFVDVQALIDLSLFHVNIVFVMQSNLLL